MPFDPPPFLSVCRATTASSLDIFNENCDLHLKGEVTSLVFIAEEYNIMEPLEGLQVYYLIKSVIVVIFLIFLTFDHHSFYLYL